MRLKAMLMVFGLSVLSGMASAETVHWSARVKWVTVFDNDSAWVGLDNLHSPNPASSVWNCGNIVWLGSKDVVSPKNMLSTALTLYATKKVARIGVQSVGDACEAKYLSARE